MLSFGVVVYQGDEKKTRRRLFGVSYKVNDEGGENVFAMCEEHTEAARA